MWKLLYSITASVRPFTLGHFNWPSTGQSANWQ